MREKERKREKKRKNERKNASYNCPIRNFAYVMLHYLLPPRPPFIRIPSLLRICYVTENFRLRASGFGRKWAGLIISGEKHMIDL